MYRVSFEAGKNLIVEYMSESIFEACEMAEKMQTMKIYNSISDSSWGVMSVRWEEVKDDE